MRVSDGMTHEPVSSNESQTIIDAKKLMEEKEIRRLPIVDENRRLLGYTTYNMVSRASSLTSPRCWGRAGRVPCGAGR